MYVLTSSVWTLQNYKKFIDFQTHGGDIVGLWGFGCV